MKEFEDYVAWAHELADKYGQRYYILKNKYSLHGYEIVNEYEYILDAPRLLVIYDTSRKHCGG